MSSVVSTLYDLVVTPGSSLKLLPVIKVVCACIITLCSIMIYKDIAAVHMYVLVFLAFGLLGSVYFLVHELEKAGGPVTDPSALQSGREGKGMGGRNKSD